jgi:NAD dependent epimerase/dehydratase family
VSSSTTPESLPLDPGVTLGPVDEPQPEQEARGVLVIGGAGFIGSHLVDRLIAEGEAVDVVDDLSTGSLAHLADARAAVATGVSSELRISTMDAGGDSLTELVAMRRPREIWRCCLGRTPRLSPRVALSTTFCACSRRPGATVSRS